MKPGYVARLVHRYTTASLPSKRSPRRTHDAAYFSAAGRCRREGTAALTFWLTQVYFSHKSSLDLAVKGTDVNEYEDVNGVG